MDIRQLETFVAVVDSESFSKAAERLDITQPTVSSYIHSLEGELKTKLIKRTTKEFYLTEAGEILYSYSLNILSLKEKAMDELLGERKKKLVIGTSSTLGLGLMPQLLSDFNKIFSEINIELYNSDTMEIIEKVNDGTLELGFVGGTSSIYRLKFIPFMMDNLVLVMQKNEYYKKILSSKNPIEKLFKEPFIIREDKSGTKKEIEKYLDKHNISKNDINIVFSINDPIIILECIKKGLGVSIMSQKTADIFKKYDEFYLLPLSNESFMREFYITYVDEKYLSDLAKEFLKFVCLSNSVDFKDYL